MTKKPSIHDGRFDLYQESRPGDLLNPSHATQGPVTGHHRTLGIWLVSMLAAVGVLVFSTVVPAKYYYAKGETNALSVGPSGGARGVSMDLEVSEENHHGDNPNAKDTYICTGDTTVPVLMGVDLVAYFSLEKDAPAVFGSKYYTSIYNGYLFYFSSAENQQLFEVGVHNPQRHINATKVEKNSDSIRADDVRTIPTEKTSIAPLRSVDLS